MERERSTTVTDKNSCKRCDTNLKTGIPVGYESCFYNIFYVKNVYKVNLPTVEVESYFLLTFRVYFLVASAYPSALSLKKAKINAHRAMLSQIMNL